MPDIYMLTDVDDSDFITAQVAQAGYPLYMGRAIALLSRFDSLGDAARYFGNVLTTGIIDMMDFIHPAFGPDDDFVDDLRYAESGIFPLQNTAVYVDFDRFDAMGRSLIVIILAAMTKLGLTSYIASFATGWLAKWVTSERHQDLVEKVDSISHQLTLLDSNDGLQASEDSLRLANMERYLHMLGDALRTNSKSYNNELEFRSFQTKYKTHLVPEWPRVEN